MWNATRLVAVNLLLALTLAACGGGGSSSYLPDNGGNVQNPGTPGGGNSGGNDGGGDTGGSDDDGGIDDGAGNGDGDDSGDASKPSVVSTDPSDRSELVSVGASITVTFDTSIDPQSVDGSMVHLIGPSGEVALELSVEDKQLMMKPELALIGGVSYTAVVEAGVRDLAGNSMDSDYSWQFNVANEITGVCSDFYLPGFSLIEGKHHSWPLSGLLKPVQGVAYADPQYGSCVTRASNASKLGVGWVRSQYSRRQAFNADDSLYLVIARYGRWFVHDTDTTEIVRELEIAGANAEPQWHPANPDILYYFENDGGLTIRSYNVRTDEQKVVADFRDVESINGYPGLTSITQIWPGAARAWTRQEGSPSRDARYWGLAVETSGGTGLGLITYDMETDTITGVYDYATDGGGVPGPDHVSMSPSGKYIVPSWADPDCGTTLGTLHNPCSVMAFTRDFSKAVGLVRSSPHSDIGIDANGREAIVVSNYITGWVEMVDLATGEKTNLWNMYINGNSTAMHISAKNFAKPGWVLISTYMEKTSGGWYADKIMAVEMTANPRILNLAHTYNTTTGYWSEVHATVNRDFTKILFNSNWRSGGEDMDVYMIKLPYDAVPAP